MSQSDNRKRYPFDRPGIYRICVQGFLDESWSERLGGSSRLDMMAFLMASKATSTKEGGISKKSKKEARINQD